MMILAWVSEGEDTSKYGRAFCVFSNNCSFCVTSLTWRKILIQLGSFRLPVPVYSCLVLDLADIGIGPIYVCVVRL